MAIPRVAWLAISIPADDTLHKVHVLVYVGHGVQHGLDAHDILVEGLPVSHFEGLIHVEIPGSREANGRLDQPRPCHLGESTTQRVAGENQDVVGIFVLQDVCCVFDLFEHLALGLPHEGQAGEFDDPCEDRLGHRAEQRDHDVQDRQHADGRVDAKVGQDVLRTGGALHSNDYCARPDPCGYDPGNLFGRIEMDYLGKGPEAGVEERRKVVLIVLVGVHR
mmetsp:Transcript_84831/g.235223  ORF Transcript_84831/g.235223 Transcript_84831/m.235223 type:complete len:221 (-) Transcript_84831:843-1505(-)